MGAKILVVEDDGGTAETLLNGLRQEGYVCEHVADGRDAPLPRQRFRFRRGDHGRMLPGMDGLSVLKALRAADVHTPLLILSALGHWTSG
jgi:two-component system OmpR family response regulator